MSYEQLQAACLDKSSYYYHHLWAGQSVRYNGIDTSHQDRV